MFTQRLIASLLFALVCAGTAKAWDSTDNDQFELASATLISQTPMGDDTELTFSGQITNLSVGIWSSVSVGFDLPPGVVQTHPMIFESIGPLATAASTRELVVLAPNDSAPAVIAGITLGLAGYQVNGTETPVYAGPVEEYDEETDNEYVSCVAGTNPDELVCSFATATPLLDRLDPGDFLIIGDYRATPSYTLDTVAVEPSMLPNLPAEVLATAGSTPFTLTVRRISDATEIVQTGSFAEAAEVEAQPSTIDVDDYEIQVDDCNPAEAPMEAPCYLPSMPIRFNDIELQSGLIVSGEIALRLFRPNARVRIRPGDESSIMLGFDAGYSLTLTAEALANINLLDAEATLFTINVPVTTLNLVVPIYVTASLDFLVGAEGNLSAGTALSFHQEGTAELGLTFSTANGLTGYSDFNGIPAAITIPELTELAQAEARVWGGLEAAVRLSTDPGNVVGGAGPVYRFNVGAALTVDPLTAQPFDLNYDARHQATFEVHLPAWEINPLESEEFVKVLDRADPGAKAGVASSKSWSPVETGKFIRWARVLEERHYASDAGTLAMKQTPLSDRQTLFYGKSLRGGFVGKLDRRGRPVWEREIDLSSTVIGAVELDDGTLLLAGMLNNDLWLAVLDQAGTLLELTGLATDPVCTIEAMARGQGAAADRIVLAGRVSPLGVSKSDVCAIGLDLDRNLQWAKYFESFGEDEARDVIGLASGQFAFAGTGQIETADASVRVGGMIGAFDSNGDPLWMRLATAPTGEHFVTMTEGPDGAIYAAGATLGCVCAPDPALWAARIDPDGQNFDHYLYDQDFEWEDELGPYTPTSSGSTAYDEAFDIAFHDNGLVIAGKTGRSISGPLAAWLLRLTPSMAVDWMVTYDGLGDEAFYDVTPSQGGLQVLGTTTSHLPDAERGLLLLRPPNEGLMRFAAQTDTISRNVQPRVVRGAGLSRFATADGSFFDVPWTVSNLVTAPVNLPSNMQLLPLSSTVSELAAVNQFLEDLFSDGFE